MEPKLQEELLNTKEVKSRVAILLARRILHWLVFKLTELLDRDSVLLGMSTAVINTPIIIIIVY